MIVTIVILAILIGITIGGITNYVHKARVNTDIANAQAIERVLQPLLGRSDLSGKEYEHNPALSFNFRWSDKRSIPIPPPEVYSPIYKRLLEAVADLFPDGLPAVQSGGSMRIEVQWDINGNLISIGCTAYAERYINGETELSTPLEPLE